MSKRDDDETFFNIQLANLFPGYASGGWPQEYAHQQTLAAACNECVQLMRTAEHDFQRIDDNKDLTPDARKRRKAELAASAMAKLEASPTYNRASEAVEYISQRYEQKIVSALKPANDPQTVGVHAQIRAQLHDITDQRERVKFLSRNGEDITLISACLGAPAYVSALTGDEVALLRANLEKHTDPSVIDQYDWVKSAWNECQRGYRAAKTHIRKRGNLPSDLPKLETKPTEQVLPRLKEVTTKDAA